MKIRKDDQVMVLAGKHKGHIGKVLEVQPKNNKAVVEGVNPSKRTIKATVNNPRSTQVEINRPIHVSNLGLVGPDGKKPSRVGYEIKAKGEKVRVYRQAGNKEVK